MQRVKPVTNEIYHIYNRGVDKRTLFLDDVDYLRFIHDLFEFNNTEPAIKVYIPRVSDVGHSQMVTITDDDHVRKFIVEILAFALMPNHFHLMVRQLTDGGISNFIKK